MKRQTIIVAVVIAAALCGGLWLVLSPRASVPPQSERAKASDFFGSTRDYPTSGGQQMKPRWDN